MSKLTRGGLETELAVAHSMRRVAEHKMGFAHHSVKDGDYFNYTRITISRRDSHSYCTVIIHVEDDVLHLDYCSHNCVFSGSVDLNNPGFKVRALVVFALEMIEASTVAGIGDEPRMKRMEGLKQYWFCEVPGCLDGNRTG